MRARILAEPPSERELARQGQFIRFVATRWDRMFVMGSPPDYEPTADKSVAAIAARTNHTPDEIAYDYLTEGAENFLFFPVVGYVHGDHEQIRELLLDPATLLGLSDGGAHCGQIVDAGLPTYMLAHWGRDRSRGPGMTLEHLVRMQTSETADFFGFHDRGRLKPGLRADVNLIDFDRLRLHQPEIVHDLPAGGRRLVQRVDGYRATPGRRHADLRARRGHRRPPRPPRAQPGVGDAASGASLRALAGRKRTCRTLPKSMSRPCGTGSAMAARSRFSMCARRVSTAPGIRCSPSTCRIAGSNSMSAGWCRGARAGSC